MLPTLNERDNVVPLIEDIYTAVPDVHEVIVVDDASTDGTRQAVRAYAQAHPKRNVRLLLRNEEPGLTQSIESGVGAATGETVVWLDADLSMPAETIPSLLAGLAEGYDIVVGSRFVYGGSFKRNTKGTEDSAIAVALSRLMNYSVQFLLDHRFKDYTSGFVAVRRSIVMDVGLHGDYGEYFMDFMFRAIRAGYFVLEVPYVCIPRLHGTSKTGGNLVEYINRGRAYLATALRLRVSAILRLDRAVRSVPAYEPAVDHSSFTIRPMGPDDVPFVAGLHHRLLYNTLNSRLGTHFLQRLYASLLGDPRARCWVAVSRGVHIAFISTTRDLHRSQARATAAVPLRERALAGLHVLADPADLWRFASHELLVGYVGLLFAKPFATILTLGVTERMWGTGLADRLIDTAEAGFALDGIRTFHVDAASSNRRALAFYEKVGFVRVGQVAGNVVLRRSAQNSVGSSLRTRSSDHGGQNGVMSLFVTDRADPLGSQPSS